MRLKRLAVLALMACGNGDPPAFGQDWAMVIGTTPLVPAGCCLQILAGQHDWAVQNTSTVPIDCEAQPGEMAIVTYELGPPRRPTRLEYVSGP